jgi:hypothetical protein
MNQIKDRQLVIDFLIDNFDFNQENAINWVSSFNANFGSSPEDLIEADRVDKIMLFLIAAKEGY